jgi:hypothetical protein
MQRVNSLPFKPKMPSEGDMARVASWLMIGALAITGHVVLADDLTLLESPVRVTANFNALDEGGYAAQIGVLNGPITQLVHTVVHADAATNVQRVLRKQVQWRAPYLFVHSSCGGGRALRCEGEAVFKVVEGAAIRLGDVIGTAPAIYNQNHFVDVYDKLDDRSSLTLDVVPSFFIVLDDVGDKFSVNASATWLRNANIWQANSDLLANTKPSGTGSEMSPQYFTALIRNAALARYCNRDEQLQALLSVEKLTLTADQMRLVTETLAKVTPLELPRSWRKPY